MRHWPLDPLTQYNDMSEARPPQTPEGVIPYLTVGDGEAAVAFYEAAFGAKLLFKQLADDGKRVLHASLTVNGGMLFLSDDFPEMRDSNTGQTPEALGGTPVQMHLQVADVDAAVARAVEAGGVVEMPVQNMFWGDRYGRVRDPFGHAWTIATTLDT